MDKLTKAQIEALKWIEPYHDGASQTWADRPGGFTSAMFGGLVRRGLLNSTMQHEHVRGERLIAYAIYQITEAGRQALSDHQGDA